VPGEVLKSLKIVFVDHVDEVLPLALSAKEDELFGGRAHCMLFSPSLRRNAQTDSPAPAQ